MEVYLVYAIMKIYIVHIPSLVVYIYPLLIHIRIKVDYGVYTETCLV